MSIYTPGPWKFSKWEQFGHTSFYVSQADGAKYTEHYSDTAELIAETVRIELVSIQEANARLIAAAPELLAALEACLSYGSMTGGEWVIEKAQEAIAKALGE